MYYLADFSLGKAIVNNPGKTILAAGALGGAGAVGASYLNKKDKRTLRQRVTDVAINTLPVTVIGATALSNKASRLQDLALKKYGNKGLYAATAGMMGATLAGSIGAQQLRRRHGDNTQKRKKGQRLKSFNMNNTGLKYKDYAALRVQ